MYVTSPNHFVEFDPVVGSESFVNAETCSRSVVRTIAAGNLLFCEGDESLQVYEILDGVVRSSKMLCDGRRQIMAFGYPGDVVGISHDCRYHSDCEVISTVKVRVHRKNACSADVRSEPEFCGLLMKHAAAEMSNMQEHFMMLGRKSALEKVSSFLAVLSDRVADKNEEMTVFNLPMSRADIADFLGLTIETVSRTFTKLRKEGVINLPNPHKVEVRSPRKLRLFAERED